MKKRYLSPESEVVSVSMSTEILSESYIYGGAGTYSEDDIIDNGTY